MIKSIISWVKEHPVRAMFLIPILLVAGISISHVVSWYDLTNPISWAIYLSIAIEVGAMTALVAATNRIKGGVWFMFGLVTFIQMIGNIFFSFKEIDVNGDLFKSWVELTSPVWEMLGSDINDVVSQKRWLAFLGGGLLPIISLTSLHFFVKYDELTKEGDDEVKSIEVEKIVEVPVEVIKEVEKIVEVTKEVIVEKEIVKEVPVEVVKEIEKIVTITNNEELEEKIFQLNKDLESERKIFSTKTEEMENNFQNEMSKKEQDLDELRRSLDIIKENDKTKLLQDTLQNLRGELQQKNEQIKELEKINRDLLNGNQNQAYLLRGSNLNRRV